MEKAEEYERPGRADSRDPYGERPPEFFVFLWRYVTNGASPEEFDACSFVGGLCFGTGTCIILGRALRSFCLVGAGGICSTLLLNHYGLISLNRREMKHAFRNSVHETHSKMEVMLHDAENPFVLLTQTLLGNKLPKDRVLSAIVGTATGFAFGLLVL